MQIIGVSGHINAAVDAVDGHLRKQYPGGIDSLMVELSQNTERRMQETNPRDHFFVWLAERWRKRGAKIIEGDTALRYFPPESGLGRDWYMTKLLVDQITQHTRDIAAIKAVRRYDPRVALFGSGHADRLKLAFPNAYYTRIEVGPKTLPCNVLGTLFSLLNGTAVPDEIVYLNLADNTTRREVRGNPNLVQSAGAGGLYFRPA